MSPCGADRVTVELLVRRHQNEAVFDGLAQEHPVEWILVERGEARQLEDGPLGQRELLESVIRYGVWGSEPRGPLGAGASPCRA